MTTAESEYPIRARVDDGKEWPQALAERVYSDAFLSVLTECFGFDALEPNTARILRGMAASYIYGRRAENDPYPSQGERRRYLALQKATERYLALIKHSEKYDIGSDMASTAYQLGRPKTEPRNDKIFYQELVQSLELLHTAIAHGAQAFKSRGGRPKNIGLDILSSAAAAFWEFDLDRRFTIDHHRGKGLTPAFDFVKALITQLDDVSDQQIITAMRTVDVPRRNRRRR